MTTATEPIYDDLFKIPDPDPLWKPTYYTKSKSPLTQGPDLASFAKAFFIAPRGVKANKPLELARWQEWLLSNILEQDLSTGYFRYRKVLVGVPRKNGKSILLSVLTLFYLVFSRGGEQIYCAATSSKQARIIFDEAVKQVQRSPYLRDYVIVRRDYLENRFTGAKLRPISSDAGRAQGLGPFLTAADELEAWPEDQELYKAMTTGSFDRPESIFIGICTAGDKLDSFLGQMFQYGKKVASGEVDDHTFGFFWWCAEEDDDPFSPDTWRKSNPSFAEGLMPIKNFEAAVRTANGLDMNAFLRDNLNLWVRLNGQSFISAFHWKKAMRSDIDIPLGSSIVVGMDGSRTDDASGLVIMDLDGNFKLYKGWEKPKGSDSWVVPRDEVEDAVDELFANYDVKMLYGDPAYWGTDLDNWTRKYPKRIMSIHGGAVRMRPIVRDFQNDLYKDFIHHDGGDRLTSHVSNAIIRENGTPGKVKAHSPHKIDFLMCAILANGARRHVLAQKKKTRPALPF